MSYDSALAVTGGKAEFTLDTTSYVSLITVS